MVELYVDDVSLENIKHEKGGQLLIFTNEVNGEALSVKVSNMELQNIYWQIQKHCSALDYISILNKRNDTNYKVVAEYCPECEDEIVFVWDICRLGYKAYCPKCGSVLMLCSECSENYICDYDSDTKSCKFNNN